MANSPDPEQLPETDLIQSSERPTSDHSTGMYQVWMLAISLALLQVGFGIVMPIFPYYIVALGVGATELGVLAASFAITRILFAGPLGRLSDKVGRKPVLLGSLIGFAIANIIYAMAQDIFVMILARALEGGISAGFFPAANAFVSDVTVPKNRGTAMGYLSMGNMMGFIIGPMVGGALAQFLGIRIPFVIAAIAALGTFVAVLALLVEPITKTTRAESTRSVIPLGQIFTRHVKSYTALGVAMFANMFAMGILEVAFMLDAVVRFNVTPLEIGIFFGFIGVFTVIGNVGFGYLSDHHGRKWLIVSGGLIGAVSLYMFVISSDIVGFMFAGIVLAVGMSMRGPTIQALIGDLTDENAYGIVMGAFGAISNGAYAISPLLSGLMYDSSGNSISSLMLAIVVTLAGAGVAAVGLPSGIINNGVSDISIESNDTNTIDL